MCCCCVKQLHADSKESKASASKMDIDSSVGESAPVSAAFAVVGSWHREEGVRVLALPALTPVATLKLEGDTIPRSVMFAQFHSAAARPSASASASSAAALKRSADTYVFVGLGDGHLITCTFTPPATSASAGSGSALGRAQPLLALVLRLLLH